MASNISWFVYILYEVWICVLAYARVDETFWGHVPEYSRNLEDILSCVYGNF